MTLNIDTQSHNTITSYLWWWSDNSTYNHFDKENIADNLSFTNKGDYVIALITTNHNPLLQDLGEVMQIASPYAIGKVQPELYIRLQWTINDGEKHQLVDCLIKNGYNKGTIIFGTEKIQQELKAIEQIAVSKFVP